MYETFPQQSKAVFTLVMLKLFSEDNLSSPQLGAALMAWTMNKLRESKLENEVIIQVIDF